MIFRSPHADVHIPDVPFHRFVLHQAEKLKAMPALIDAETDRILTYGELARDVCRVAGALAARGMRKGDVFALMLPNVPEFATAFFGVLAAGGVITTVNPLYTPDEIAHQLEDSGAKYFLTLPQLLEKAVEAAAKQPLREIFVVGETVGATPFSALLAADCTPPSIDINPSEDLAVLPYSSGTTGKPKGVMLTHANLVAGVLAVAIAFPRDTGTTYLGILPFFHIAGMVCILHSVLYLGGKLALMRRFEPESFLQTIQKYRIEVAPLVPPLVVVLAKHPVVEKYDLSSLKLVTSGAAPLGADMQCACQSRLGTPVIQGYGLTETTGLTHGNVEAISTNKPGSVGPCGPNTQCKIVDVLAGTELGANEQGELWLRSPQLMKGYLNNPSATAECLDRDGWYHTGDIGYVDEDGYFYIVDRLKELIKYKGFQVAPAELEALLLTHPSIVDAAVIPSPDEQAGEVPKAFLVTRNPVSVEEVLNFVAARVAPYKKIRRVEFVENLPKSPAGKLLRRVLRDRERSRTYV
ncbi:MAG TPA: AMP-binding protein [Candidatus Acidoferrum sp.]|nr:AMP-binding protein [Candidatus Acidoferrum sp.]